MSVNAPFTEINRTVLATAQLAVSTADLISGFPILAPDGGAADPSYSFASNTTGLFRSSSGVSSVVDAEVGLVAGAAGNVAIGAPPTDYGNGEGVVFLPDGVNPVGIPNSGSGGILYVDGAELNYLDSSGTTVSLTTAGGSNVTGPPSSLDNQLATFSSTTGRVVSNSGIRYESDQLLTGDGSVSAPAYAFITEPSTGMYISGTSLSFSVLGAEKLALNSVAATFSVPFISSFTGSAATPEFSFTSSVSSGMLYDSNHFQISTGGDVGLSVGGTLTRNVSLSDATTYGADADGVMFVPTASTVPVGVPNGGSGGVLYAVGGTELWWLDASGTPVLLGGSVPPTTAADGQMAVWANTTGSAMDGRTVVTDAGAIHAVQTDPDNPAYSFTASTNTGMVKSVGVAFQAATDQCVDITSTSMTACVPLLPDAGAIAGPAYSFSSSTNSGVYSHVSGAVSTSVNGTEVWAAHADNNVSFGVATSDFGLGEGMLRLEDGTAPSTAPASGGLLYVDTINLVFRDTANVAHTLTSTTSVSTVATSTDNAVVRFDTTDGKVVQSSGVLILDSGEVSAEYSFTSSPTSGLVSGGANTINIDSAGTTGLTISPTGITVSGGLTGIDGTAAAPSLAFGTTGLYLSGTNTLAGSSMGVRGLVVTDNVGFGTDTPDFAGGAGVVYFSDVTTVPSSPLSNGGLLYVSGRELVFYDKDGVVSNVSGVEGLAGASTDEAIVTLADTLGRQLKESGFTLTAGQIRGVDGSGGVPTYRVGSVGWWYGGGNVVEMGNGAAQLSLSSSNVTASVQVDIASTLQIGGGMTETFSTPTTTRNIADASGIFAWHQTGTPIFQTDTSENVDLLSHFALCTGATDNLRVGFNGTEFGIDVLNAADSLDFSVGGTVMATCGSTGVTCANAVGENFRAGTFGFTSSPTTGLTGGVNLEVNGIDVGRVNAGAKLSLLTSTANTSGNRSVLIPEAASAPTSSPVSGAYLYCHPNNTFMRVCNSYVDVAVNGPVARAKISRTQTIATGAIDLIDTLVDVESNILVVDTAAPGAGTVTGTVDTAGWWEISGEAHWASNATGFRRIRIKVGGVVVGDSTQNAVSGMETQHQVRVCLNVAASAVVTFEVEQNSGGNLDVDVIGTVVFMG